MSLSHDKAHLWVGFVLDRGRIKELRGVCRVPILILSGEVDTAPARTNVVTQSKSLPCFDKGQKIANPRPLELSHLTRVANHAWLGNFVYLVKMGRSDRTMSLEPRALLY
jgi:hypothetical protein